MELVSKDVRDTLPGLYSTEHEEDPIAYAKFFTPWSSWTWFATEYDGDDTFFGLVDGFVMELGYFKLSELESLRGPGGLRIERDEYFRPTAVSELMRTRR